MPVQFQLPLPEQRAAEALRQQIVDHLLAKRPAIGSALFSESELMRRTKLSRSTVRRALEPLERTGWIERQQGKGTFVGPRAGLTPHQESVPDASYPAGKRLTRLAVVADRATPWNDDPYSRGIVAGLDAAADEGAISVELLGFSRTQPEIAVRRLRQSRPDLIALIAPREEHARIIGAAMLMKIPCLGTSHSSLRFGISTVSYDDDIASRNAVLELARLGHRRIALIQTEATNQFVHRRQRGYREGIRAANLHADNNLELTLPQWNAAEEEAPPTHVQLIESFVRQTKVTAALVGESKITGVFGALHRSGSLVIPRDLSLLTFDDNQSLYAGWFGGMRLNAVALPLEQIGRSLADLARRVLEEPARQIAICLPCAIVPGESALPRQS